MLFDLFFFFFKQKTAYEISDCDWSSDVCSSDLSYLENSQLEPDIKVANSPETIVKGEDTQLKAAVEELLKELEK